MSTPHETPLAILKRGIFTNNTIFGMAISLCPAIAVTTTMKNGFYMGVAVLFVQTAVQVIISLIRKFIDPRVRIPMFMVIIAGLVTIMDRSLSALVPAVYAEMGLYIQLIVAFASILAGIETYALKAKPLMAAIDGFARGFGFLGALIIIGGLRELLGKGTLWALPIVPFKAISLISLPAGGFITVAFLLALVAYLRKRSYPVKACDGCAGGKCAEHAAAQ